MNYFHLRNLKYKQIFCLKGKELRLKGTASGKAKMLIGIAVFPVIDDRDNGSYIHTLKWLSFPMTAV